MSDLHLHLRDLNPDLVAAWELEFKGLSNVTISQGDIFSTDAARVKDEKKIDIIADAIISPANSFGFMDGGIDAVYTHVLGPKVQEALKFQITEYYNGELPVGRAIIVPTQNGAIPWCISAPTMRTPGDVSNTLNAYLALRAAVLAVKRFNAAIPNEDAEEPIRIILCPGLGTAVGRMPPDRCARQMAKAWHRTTSEAYNPDSLSRAIADEVLMLE